jgi:predicted N-formylglutamate amidohydrolase
VLDGVVRNADVGLLYDPCRAGERELCARWKASLAGLVPRLRVRLNYPYAGKGDGVTRLMRKRYPPQTYIGVELEVNQGVLAADASAWPELRAVLIESLRDATRSTSCRWSASPYAASPRFASARRRRRPRLKGIPVQFASAST